MKHWLRKSNCTAAVPSGLDDVKNVESKAFVSHFCQLMRVSIIGSGRFLEV